MAVELPRGLNVAKLAVFGASAPVVAHSAILALPESGTAKYQAITVVPYGNYVVVWMLETPASTDVLQRSIQAYNDRGSTKSVDSTSRRRSRDSHGAEVDFAPLLTSGALMVKRRKVSDGSFNELVDISSFARSRRTVTTQGHPEPVAAVAPSKIEAESIRSAELALTREEFKCENIWFVFGAC